MHRAPFVLLILVMAFTFPATGHGFLEDNWPTYMGNQYLTGNNDGIIPQGNNILWKFTAPGRLYNPVGSNERVFVVSTDNHLYCLDMRDGSVLWRFKAEGALTRMVVVYQRRVYLPAGQFIYCLDMENGEVLWARKDPSIGFYGTPTVAEGKIFYGNRKGFYARELVNGHLVWENPGIYTYGGFPSYWNGMVYTVSKEFQQESARLIALDADSGEIVWETVLENVANIYSPVVYQERIYLAFGNKVGVFDAGTGEKLWEKNFIAPVASHPVFSHGNIYLSLLEGTILTIDPENGNWLPLYSVPYATQFAVVGSYLFIPVKSPKGELAVVDAVSGKEMRRITTGEGEPSSLTVSRGIAFMSSVKGLVAIGKGTFLGTVSAGPGTEVAAARLPESGKPATRQPGGEQEWPTPGEWGGTTASPSGGGEGSVTRGPGTESAQRSSESTASESSGAGTARSGPGADEATRALETTTIRGEVRERDTDRPLAGTVETTTTFGDGSVAFREQPFKGGSFEIEVPRAGETDLVVSSPGYTFETITLPDEEAVDDLSLAGLEVSLSRARGGEELRVDSIHFETGKANLSAGSIPTLQKIHDMMRENPGIRIEIAGHTDSTGSKELNQRLSELRAESVASWLIQNGIPSTRITTKGFGESRPIADNATEEGRRRNRRTEIRILE
jgi:outer membrane protein OmpA-like peptidoglycan-associated protein/outer membrane protein assembly factor BamB